MDNFTQFANNRFIYIPVLTWLAIQTFKVLVELVKTKKLNFKRIMGAGGMPSSHSAVVMAESVLIGRATGFDSPLFALSIIFSFIVMYDAAGVRRAARKTSLSVK